MKKVKSDKVYTSIHHTEGAAPCSLRSGGGATDSEDLLPPLIHSACCCSGHVVSCQPPGAHQPVGHQPLPGATEVWPVKL